MSLKNYKISADGEFAVNEGTIKFTGTIVITHEGKGTKEEVSMKALKIEDISQDESVDESPAKSENLLEESGKEDTDTDSEDVDTDEDNDKVSSMPRMSTRSGAGREGQRSKILFHHDSDVDDDYELSQTWDVDLDL